MSGVEAGDITNIVVTAPTNRRLSTTASDVTTDAVVCSYVVRSTDPTQSYTTLSSQLSNAVSTGVFTNNLNSIAADSGATALVGCSSTSVSSQPIETSSSSSSSNKLSAGAVVGIVFGVLIGIGLFVSVMYYYTMYRERKASASDNMTNVSSAVADDISMKAEGVVMTTMENPLRSQNDK
jgi:hypothetical protein